MCVVGPGFDSTAPTFVRSRASHAQGATVGLPKKRNRAPISGGRVVLTQFVQMSVAFQHRAGCVFLDTVHYRHRGCFLGHSTFTRHTHCKHHSPRRQTQHPKRQDTLHMQTISRTHKETQLNTETTSEHKTQVIPRSQS